MHTEQQVDAFIRLFATKIRSRLLPLLQFTSLVAHGYIEFILYKLGD